MTSCYGQKEIKYYNLSHLFNITADKQRQKYIGFILVNKMSP